MRFVSKYVFLPPGTKRYTFTNVHPGTYYIYSYNNFTLPPEGSAEVDTKIDVIIP